MSAEATSSASLRSMATSAAKAEAAAAKETIAAIIDRTAAADLITHARQLFEEIRNRPLYRNVVRDLGRTRPLWGLEALRRTPGSPEEDVILEVLDYLTGWCRPELRP